MGAILSRFRVSDCSYDVLQQPGTVPSTYQTSYSRLQKKSSTSEVLEKIQSEVADIESFKRDTTARHKKVIGHLLLYFSVLYFLGAVFAYFRYFHDPEWRDLSSQAMLASPFVVAPFL